MTNFTVGMKIVDELYPEDTGTVLSVCVDSYVEVQFPDHRYVYFIPKDLEYIKEVV